MVLLASIAIDHAMLVTARVAGLLTLWTYGPMMEVMTIPIYEYKCPVCQAEYSETRGILEDVKKTQCDNCKVDYIRVFSIAAVTFNGSGFYATDKKK